MKRDMRAVWVATVNNVDFSMGQSVDEYKEFIDSLIRTLKMYNMNPLAFHIRPCIDDFLFLESQNME